MRRRVSKFLYASKLLCFLKPFVNTLLCACSALFIISSLSPFPVSGNNDNLIEGRRIQDILTCFSCMVSVCKEKRQVCFRDDSFVEALCEDVILSNPAHFAAL